MKRIALFTAVAFVLLCAPALAAPPSAVMAPIDAVLAATNADSIAGLDAYYTTDAVVVDEFPPYSWTGVSAGRQWWGALDKMGAKMGVAKMHAAAAAVQHFDVSGSNAYVVVPLTITFTLKGKPQRETGLLACTLRNVGGTWKIVTQSWATATSTM